MSAALPDWPEYPGLGGWLHTEVLGRVLDDLPGLSTVDGWIRAVPDPEEPFPAAYLELAWIVDGCLHLAMVGGCTVGVAWPGRTGPRLVDHRYVPLKDLVVLARGWPSC